MINMLSEQQKQECIENMTHNLCALRTMLNLSQAELAAIIGVARSTIVYIENRQRKMTWQTFLCLLFVFSQRKETKALLEIFGIYTKKVREVYGNLSN